MLYACGSLWTCVAEEGSREHNMPFYRWMHRHREAKCFAEGCSAPLVRIFTLACSTVCVGPLPVVSGLPTLGPQCQVISEQTRLNIMDLTLRVRTGW